MRCLVLSASGDGGWLIWLLQHEGHDVEWTVFNKDYATVMSGLIPPPLEHTGDPSDYHLIIFDTTERGQLADIARESTPTIGNSSFAEQLEKDRAFGIDVMESCGIKVPQWHTFSNVQEAKEFINKNHKRYVFKPNNQECNLTYVSKSPDDLIRYLDRLASKIHGEFTLQEFIVGTEVSTEGYFNGKEWILYNHTLEEKKFLSGNLGPNVGCAGNIVWMPIRTDPVFEMGLKKIEGILRDVNYVGPIDLNTIVTEGEVYGIEWTPRFGYEGTCNLARLLGVRFGDFLYRVACGDNITVSPRSKFCASIRVSVPPYPAKPSKKRESVDIPIYGLDKDKLQSFYTNDIKLEGDQLMVAGTSGFIGAPLGCGDSVKQAFEECKTAIKRLEIPDLQWRSDAAESIEKRYNTLMQQGWLRQNSFLGEKSHV